MANIDIAYMQVADTDIQLADISICIGQIYRLTNIPVQPHSVGSACKQNGVIFREFVKKKSIYMLPKIILNSSQLNSISIKNVI